METMIFAVATSNHGPILASLSLVDMYSYTVRCSFSDVDVSARWFQWLQEEHIQHVLDCGALSADVFEMDCGLTFEIRYGFSSKSAFEDYERNHAPRLRAEGLKKFPLSLGLEYSRTHGQLIWSRAR
jgi:hypothetical protein